MSIIGLIVLVMIVCFLFSRGTGDPYFAPGISISGILLVLLLLWMFGVFGGGHFGTWRGW